MRMILYVALAAVTVTFLAVAFRTVGRARRAGATDSIRPTPVELLIGFVTNFFDTLGIGSFAPTTSWFKLQKVVPDEQIPGTLNVGHTPPVIAQAFIFITIVQVDVLTLTTMIAASVVGAWFGAGVVAGLPRRAIQLGMGAALLVAAVTFTAANLGYAPVGGEALGLRGAGLGLAVTANLALGALMTLGIGMYAPSEIWLEVPAVILPSGLKAGLSSASFSIVVSGRMPWSVT